MESKLKKITILIVILILIVLNIVVFLYYNMNNSTQANKFFGESNAGVRDNLNYSTNENNEEKITQKTIENNISNMDEVARARVYFGNFIECIENDNYERAYSLLNASFKSNYFPTLDEFTEYMKNKYPKNEIVVKYNTIEKKGEVFAMEVTINDEEDVEFQEFSQSVVIREISTNNFSISFSKDDGRGERRK